MFTRISTLGTSEEVYGKGKGDRKNAHLDDTADTAKTKRIADIKKAGLQPIIKVIARGLSENEALLVEKTLLWKLGKWTTNIASGSFKNKFLPHNTFHKDIPDFDFHNGIYYYNVGEGTHRNWDENSGSRVYFRRARELDGGTQCLVSILENCSGLSEKENRTVMSGSEE